MGYLALRRLQNEAMIYGYARVSTAAQDESSQVRQLKAAGCEKVFREKITGTTANRPQLQNLMKRLAPGDVVMPLRGRGAESLES
jgi:DNA invertase Pin-like site-specific DNA recombinase